MSDRLRSLAAAALALLLLLLLAGWRSWGRSFGLFEPEQASTRSDRPSLRSARAQRARPLEGKAAARPERARAPLVVFFHGGGFRSGDKSSVPAWLVRDCLDEGISVASANYRLSQTATFPAPMLDGARAIQFLRHNAAELGIDPDRIAASGSSAGAGIALWVGFHDDLADSRSEDPVARAVVAGLLSSGSTAPRRRTTHGSSRRRSAAVRTSIPPFARSTASSPTPRWIRREIHKLFEEASPINYVTSDDPPAILFYAEPDAPLPPDAKPGQGIHHPRFGKALKSKLDPLGVECILAPLGRLSHAG